MQDLDNKDLVVMSYMSIDIYHMRRSLKVRERREVRAHLWKQCISPIFHILYV